MLVNLYGWLLAAGAAATSVAMMVMGGRFQRIEAAAYGGEHRPWWFIAIATVLIGFYLIVLVNFLTGADRSWAGWVLVVLIPFGWGLKAALIVFNPRGRRAVSAISGDRAWVRVGLARLPIAVLLALLAWLA